MVLLPVGLGFWESGAAQSWSKPIVQAMTIFSTDTESDYCDANFIF